MSGAEAGFVVGLIAGVISIIEATKTVYDAAKDAKGQPEAFRQVAARLSLANEILHSAKERTQTLDESAQEALEPILESCKVKAENLKKIFQKVIRKDDDKWYDRYKKALGSLGKEGRVECLMEGILKDVQVLACERLMGTATDTQVKEIEEAIKQMNEMPSSLPDEAGGVIQTHTGSGDNIGHTGPGTMNINKAARDFHQTFGSNLSGTIFYNQIATYNESQRHLSDSQTQDCLQDLRTTDPRDDKTRIEQTKGGLLPDSYRWILEYAAFLRWRHDERTRLLWIKGDPGKGKTMLLCGIINELSRTTRLKDPTTSALLSFFFCQATDKRIDNATAVLRGLIYMLLDQQPTLIPHVRRKYDTAGKQLFEDVNAWVALSEIFTTILEDSSLQSTYLIIDALDECQTGRKELLNFISQVASIPSTRVKWIVSSRYGDDIKQGLRLDDVRLQLSLELNADHVSHAVDVYIDHKVSELVSLQDEKALPDQVCVRMRQKANGTFLWVALVFQELQNVDSWNVLQAIDEMPTELVPLYDRMMGQIQQLKHRDPEFCCLVLSKATIAYRPLRLLELGAIAGLPEQISSHPQRLTRLVNKCGSFLTIRDDHVYLVHQSAKDYLSANPTATDAIFPSGPTQSHHSMFSQSLQVMSKTLSRDMYSLHSPGFPIDQIKTPEPDPLAAARYSCVYWVEHLLAGKSHDYDTQDGGIIEEFLSNKYLYWLESLSLLGSMSDGVLSLTKFVAFLQRKSNAAQLTDLVQDAYRFIMYHKWSIENNPLQTYTSALVFSPARSPTRGHFKKEEPKWIVIKPSMEDGWSPCVQTLEGHTHSVISVTFAPDGTRLASASWDNTVKIWEPVTGRCLQTLEGHTNSIDSVAFAPDGTQLASASYKTVKMWEPATGRCLQTLEGHNDSINSVAFAPDGTRLASASWDNTVKIWELATGRCLQTLKGHALFVTSVAFAPDGTQLASASWDMTVKIWESVTGCCLQTLKGHTGHVNSVAFAPDSSQLASASDNQILKVWELATGRRLQILEGHTGPLNSVDSIAFAPDVTQLASASDNYTVKIWEPATGRCLQILEGHSGPVNSVAFEPDGTQLASASNDTTVKIWKPVTGRYPQTLEGHSGSLNSVNSSAFTRDGTQLASASRDTTVKTWEPAIGCCLQTLEGHSGPVNSIAFAPNSTRLASASSDKTVKIWELATGRCFRTLEGHSDFILSVALTHDSTRLASASNDNTAKVWDLVTGRCLQTLKGHTSYVNSVTFTPDGTRLVSASGDKTVKIWELATGRCLQTLKGHSEIITSVDFTPNNTQLVSASWDKTIKIWELATGRCLQILEGHSDPVISFAFAPDGTQLVSASNDKTVKIWELATGRCLQTLEGHSGPVNSVAFTHDGTQLASASYDKTVKIWEPAIGRCLWTLKSHNDFVYLVTFTPDSTRLASASNDNTVKIWELATGCCLQTLEVGRMLSTLSFDTTGSSLHIDIGTILLDKASAFDVLPSVPSHERPKQKLRRQGYGTSWDGVWITWNSDNLLWLPPEYRPACSIVVKAKAETASPSTVVLGCTSGRVLIIRFSTNEPF